MDTLLDIDPKLKVRIRELAERQQRSAGSVIVEAIEQYVARAEARLGFQQEALESWRDFQETGLHLTFEEVSAWLDTWGTDAEGPPPPCHR
ncbi:CopG family ribbon-helix-helix protein [Bosea sp. PAMC 26642]|uniref:CopG family ribbon-helix-helix protein n=1 Tax=Bosea sp. (strain PAMC 26642) TaxID=1792307 RepID=UPI00076FF4F0|nr:CopG family ribbon-helix-helix protein [Bosea sp. PAMC 26642]AMJ59299.1 CopG family transcriptional regulator [Bosea sp. PAMC 26642]